jgi:DNA-binding NarL/FixJ family response regulator
MAQPCDYNVQLVDDHHMMRMGLIALAQASSRQRLHWFESSNLSDALDTYRAQPRIDLVLLDLNLPDSQGLQGVQRFLDEFPDARLAVFSATEDEFVVRQALALGAMGFVPKSASADATLRLVESLLQGPRVTATTRPTPWMPLACAKPVPELTGQSIHTRAAALNATQLKVLELVLAGMSNQEIAAASKLALGTVKNAVSSILLSLDVRSRSHLISMFR